MSCKCTKFINILCPILSLIVLAGMIYLFYFKKEEATSSENTTLNSIFERSSVRNYTDAPIDEATLETLVKAGMAAPTAANMQPWEVVITNKEALKEYSTINTSAKMAASAPAAIAVIGNLNTYSRNPNLSGYWAQDTSAATQNILLAAHSMGLGTVWTGVYSENREFSKERIEKTQALLKLEPHQIPLCMIILGHPSGETKPKDKWKPAKLKWIK